MHETTAGPDIIFFPYVRGIAEHASYIRKQLLARRGSDFLLAIDLPHGLEANILKAVKRLPKISLIIDTLKRGIPVVPTCGSIEAVRTFLETGYEMEFIDTSLPVCGNFGDLRRFSEYCREFGQKDVIGRAEEYGLDLNGLLFGRGGQTGRPLPSFMHLSGSVPDILTRQYSPADSPYMEARHRFMAMRINALRKEKQMDIVVVCDAGNVSAVQHYLKEPSPEFDDSFVLDTITCRVREEDIVRISPEIPFFMHHYEIFRNQEWSREHWLQELLAGMEPVPGSLLVEQILQYSRNLALTDGQLYPGLYNLLAAAKYCAGDAYALKLLERASSYPGADQDSNCRIRSCYDYNMRPLADTRVLELKADLGRMPAWAVSQGKCVPPPKRNPPPFGVIHFTRTGESLHNEKRFMRYLKHRFPYLEPTNEFVIEEFSCGLKDGIDERETLRHTFQDRIFVKERRYENTAVYVVDFGGSPTWAVYFDTQYHMVGAARRYDNATHAWVCFAAFLSPPKPMDQLLQDIDLTNPRASCIEMALEYSDHVFLFTDKEKRPLSRDERSPHVKLFDLQRLPLELSEAMRWFHLAV